MWRRHPWWCNELPGPPGPQRTMPTNGRSRLILALHGQASPCLCIASIGLCHAYHACQLVACMKTVIVRQVNIQLEAANSSRGKRLSRGCLNSGWNSSLTRVRTRLEILWIFVGKFCTSGDSECLWWQDLSLPTNQFVPGPSPITVGETSHPKCKVWERLVLLQCWRILLSSLFGKTNPWFEAIRNQKLD